MASTDVTPPGGAAPREAPTTASAPEGLFVRKSSGLVREMGWRDTLAAALSGINPFTVVALFSVGLLFASNADLTLPYILAALIMVPLTFTYAHLVAAMPRSGGDFVYASRVFHPIAGAAMGGALVVFFLLGLGANAVFVGQLFVPNFAAVLGDVFHWHALTTFSETLASSKAAWFVSSSLIVVLACLVGMRGSHALGRVMFWCLVAGLLAVLILIFHSLTHSNADFQAAYDKHTLPGAYSATIAATRDAGIETGNTFAGFLKIMPYAALGFWGFSISNFPSGELKRANRTYLAATLGALAVGVTVLVAAWLSLRHLGGLRFLQSAGALSTSDPASFEKITGGASIATPFYGDLVAGDPVTRLAMAGGFTIGGLMAPFAVVLVASRLIFALSFDRLLPTRLAQVSARRHAPLNALALVLLAGVGFAALTVFSTGYVRITRNQVLIFATVMTVAGITGMALPYRRRDLFEAAPKVISGTWLGMPPLVVVSAVVVLTQGALAFYALTNESVSGGYDAGSIAYLACTALVGVVLYAVSRAYLKRRKGIDLALAMRELPPE